MLPKLVSGSQEESLCPLSRQSSKHLVFGALFNVEVKAPLFMHSSRPKKIGKNANFFLKIVCWVLV